ncbi:MAG TPA: bifunctional adenosylcobinamide kinase/adenosylcobinamide-phosphate guanylyltransferase [Gemmataceae bacterium]|nr:bifunctional adenosylcobinamide kinase/adenosylcobinamide-phosphate guanylyltransferase [Gemmataceae bacterium]
MSLILVTGGGRSGKSTFAEQLAHRLGGDRDVCYVATADPGDDEMRARIAAHRAGRPPGWRTLEAPRSVMAALDGLANPLTVRAVLLDCLTLLVSNVLLAQPHQAQTVEGAWPAVEAEVNALIRFAGNAAVPTVVVTNEVGLGIVPDNRLARVYRDLLGWANQRLAAKADCVYLVVAGIPVDIKALQRPLSRFLGGHA